MQIASNTEIKNILGLSETEDYVFEIANEAATELLCDILGVETLDRHTVTNEEAEFYNGLLFLNDFPVDIEEAISFKSMDRVAIAGTYTYELPPRYTRTIRVIQNALPAVFCAEKLLVSYTAGYQLQSKLTVASITGLTDKTITFVIDGVSKTYVFKSTAAGELEITIGADVNACAANIAAKICGSTSALAVVTLPVGTDAIVGTANTQFTFANSDVPKLMKIAVALLAGGIIAEQTRQGGIVELKIDDKTVKFGDAAASSQFNSIIANYLGAHQNASFSAV